MLRHLQSLLGSGFHNHAEAPGITTPANMSPPTRYRLVGYATTSEEGRRLRVYIDAEAPMTPLMKVLVQATPGRFDFEGQPLGLWQASPDLSRCVRDHLLHPQKLPDLRGAIFSASVIGSE